MKFSPDYVRIVLDENFEDAKAQLLEPLMALEYAHLVMLADRKIVTPRRGRVDPQGAGRDSPERRRDPQSRYDGTCEDLFFYIERLVVAGCGEDAAGRLHTATIAQRHRHEMYRMAQRRLILA